MAAFLPALLLCDRWQMLGHVRPPQGKGEMIYHRSYSGESLLSLPSPESFTSTVVPHISPDHSAYLKI